MNDRRFKTVDEFWPYYVNEHSKYLTRQLHFVGMINLIIWMLLAVSRRRLGAVIFALASSYGFAWVGHFFVERNKPATFDYPVLSALAEMRMFGKMLRGEMAADVARYVLSDD